MKQKNAIYLVVALATFAIFSCSKEEIIDLDNNAPGQKAVISIKVVGAGNNLAQSRAAGAAATTDAVINDYVAFTFREGGALDNTPFYVRFDPNQPGDVEEPRLGIGTTAAKKVYIIANVGPLADSPFANVKTEAELLAVTGDLMENSNVTTQTEDNLWMSGVNDVSFSTSPDGYIYGGTTVSLNFVAAKIELVVQDVRTVPVAILRLQIKVLHCCLPVKVGNSLVPIRKKRFRPSSIQVMFLIVLFPSVPPQNLLF